MSVLSTTLPTLRDGIARVLDTIGIHTAAGLKVYDFEPRDFDQLPAAMIKLPAITRRRPDERDNVIGRADLATEWPVDIVIALDDPQTGQNAALEWAGRIVGAFDDNPTLLDTNGAGVQYVVEAVVAELTPAFSVPEPEENRRALVIYSATVAVLSEHP
ncbi:MAG: hypothetical protein ACKVWR_21895 [Acidimicrobiales bacterium]